MLIYDGDCAFCTRCAMWVRRRLPETASVVAWQAIDDLGRYGLTEADVETAAYWVDAKGEAHRGYRAIARSLIAIGRAWAVLGYVLLVPPVSWLAAVAYRVIAANRHRMPGGTAACQIGTPGARRG